MRVQMRRIITNSYLVLFVGLCSCTKYLDVKPEDKLLSESVFNDKYNINKAINGIYINLAKPSLYGQSLTMSTVDMMAQYYNFYPNRLLTEWNAIPQYQYQESIATEIFEEIWDKSYLAILNINSFIEQLEPVDGILTKEQKDILLGEAYGLRAFIHFDMLRLFGPVFTINQNKESIPYLNRVVTETQPLLPANEVVKLVLEDLAKAKVLLEKDPIRTEGVQQMIGLGDDSDFYKLRNRRFNYYAVLGMQARVLLYSGMKQEALQSCEELLDEGSKFFNWTPLSEVQPMNPNANRVFYSEVIFGLDSYAMYESYRSLFAPTLTEYVLLVPTKTKLLGLYEGNEDDYRYRVNWADGIASGKDYKTFVKYQDVSSTSVMWRNFQPLLRISEIYYIAAECTANNKELSLGYLDAVRSNRGLIGLNNNVNIEQEIEKEYKKEFIGEGQLFFYYKRKNKLNIPYPIDGYGNIPMTEEEYVVPLPLKELQYRKK